MHNRDTPAHRIESITVRRLARILSHILELPILQIPLLDGIVLLQPRRSCLLFVIGLSTTLAPDQSHDLVSDGLMSIDKPRSN